MRLWDAESGFNVEPRMAGGSMLVEVARGAASGEASSSSRQCVRWYACTDIGVGVDIEDKPTASGE